MGEESKTLPEQVEDALQLPLAGGAFVKDLKTALATPPEVLAEVGRSLNTELGIHARDEKRVRAIWRKAGLPDDALTDTVSVLKHLFERIAEKRLDTTDALEAVRRFCTERGIVGFAEREAALRIFLTPLPAYVRRRLALKYAKAVTPALTAVSGAVGLRCAFVEPGSEQLAMLVPVVEIQIKTETADSEREGSFAFLTTEKGMEELIEHLKLYKKQLVAAKKSCSAGVSVYTPDAAQSE
jgi:hypothetical protein